jgi:glycosyltransferase involved in cell wall biosynthesis
MPKVTVVSSFYNEGWHVKDTLDSILSQTERDIAVVCVDDGSSDDTLACLHAYRDPRVRIVAQANQGLGAALRNGFADADSEYLAYHEAGDDYRADRLERQIARLEAQPDCAVVSCHSRSVGVDKSWTRETRPDAAGAAETLLTHNPFPHSGTLYRQSAYDAAGGYRAFFRYRQDLDLLLRLSERHAFAVVPEILVTVLRHSESVSVKPAKRLLARRYREFAVYCAAERRAGRSDPLETFGPGAALMRPRSRLMADEFAQEALKASWRGDRDSARTFVAAAIDEAVTARGLAATIGAHVPMLPQMRAAYQSLRRRAV